MPHPQGKQPHTVVTACTRSDGLPDFALTEVEVTEEAYKSGVHYDLTEVSLTRRGYTAPFLHFDEDDAPQFLFPAVRDYLGLDTRAAAPPSTP